VLRRLLPLKGVAGLLLLQEVELLPLPLQPWIVELQTVSEQQMSFSLQFLQRFLIV
jgi:hypothetical protein